MDLSHICNFSRENTQRSYLSQMSQMPIYMILSGYDITYLLEYQICISQRLTEIHQIGRQLHILKDSKKCDYIIVTDLQSPTLQAQTGQGGTGERGENGKHKGENTAVWSWLSHKECRPEGK